MSMSQLPPSDLPIVLFDGTCGMCDWSVAFVAPRAGRKIRFIPRASDEGRALLERFGIADDSMVAIDPQQRATVRSDAVLAVIGWMRWPWPLLRVAAVVPRFLRDAIYRFIARHRHRLLPAPQRCPLLTKGQTVQPPH